MTVRKVPPLLWSLVCVLACSGSLCLAESYPIVDTGQVRCYDDANEIAYPSPGKSFDGQDAQYEGHQPSYRDNGDGTVSDLVTGLMWQKSPGEKKTFPQAMAAASACRLAGHDDWRLPTIKELYSLILFSGIDPDPQSTDTGSQRPFLDERQFEFHYGDPNDGERIIDSQYATSTRYVSTTMHGADTMFGVNFADGRIKGYPIYDPRRDSQKTFCVQYVRGNPDYGKNDFHDNGDGTITDRATGLTWAKLDSGHLQAGEDRDGRLNWQQALQWTEDLELAGHTDWRLPNIKELQSIVDYSRSPDTTGSAAIDPMFEVTSIKAEDGRDDFPYYWSSTTHVGHHGGSAGAYVAFGRSPGWMPSRRGGYDYLDVHGAGSQRSDPKSGDASRFPHGRGPQGDVIRILNFVRPVRGGVAERNTDGPPIEMPAFRRPGRPPAGVGRQSANLQGPPPPDGGRPSFVKRLDRDGDGRVSRTEFDGPPAHFPYLDQNNDGYLTEDEAPSPRPMGERPAAGGRPSGQFRPPPPRR